VGERFLVVNNPEARLHHGLSTWGLESYLMRSGESDENMDDPESHLRRRRRRGGVVGGLAVG
jgi:hypothetical protein